MEILRDVYIHTYVLTVINMAIGRRDVATPTPRPCIKGGYEYCRKCSKTITCDIKIYLKPADYSAIMTLSQLDVKPSSVQMFLRIGPAIEYLSWLSYRTTLLIVCVEFILVLFFFFKLYRKFG